MEQATCEGTGGVRLVTAEGFGEGVTWPHLAAAVTDEDSEGEGRELDRGDKGAVWQRDGL